LQELREKDKEKKLDIENKEFIDIINDQINKFQNNEEQNEEVETDENEQDEDGSEDNEQEEEDTYINEILETDASIYSENKYIANKENLVI